MSPKDYEVIREKAREKIAEREDARLLEGVDSETIAVDTPEELVELVRKAG
jgi:hypothetical protein